MLVFEINSAETVIRHVFSHASYAEKRALAGLKNRQSQRQEFDTMWEKLFKVIECCGEKTFDSFQVGKVNKSVGQRPREEDS